MNRKAFPTRLMGLLVAFVLVVGAWSAAQARIHSLSGNARFQIGDGLPIPIVFNQPPTGGVNATPNATIRVHGIHAATAPARVVIDPSQLTFVNPPGINLPLFNSNPNVFQVKTNLSLQFPRTKISFKWCRPSSARFGTTLGSTRASRRNRPTRWRRSCTGTSYSGSKRSAR